MFICALTLVVIAFAPVVLAQSYLAGLQQVLNANGLTQLANVTTILNGTEPGQRVLSELSQGSKTLFAPTNAALAAANPAFLSNQTVLADIIAYHIVSGSFLNLTQTYPNVTVGRTLLNDSDFVTLEGNKGQVVAWFRVENGSLFVQNHGTNVSVVNQTSYSNTPILVIDSVLTPPPNTASIFNNASYDIGSASSILQSTTIASGESVSNALISAHGFTAFVPNNEAVQAAQSNLSSISGNSTALQDVLENHIINGTSVYSPSMLANLPFLSAGGQLYVFFINATGLYVAVGGSNEVQVLQSNVLTSNGVIHIVNGVMFDTRADFAAASSAYVSATSVAARTTTTETGPVGTGTGIQTGTPTPTSHADTVKSLSDRKLGGLLGMLVFLGQMI